MLNTAIKNTSSSKSNWKYKKVSFLFLYFLIMGSYLPAFSDNLSVTKIQDANCSCIGKINITGSENCVAPVGGLKVVYYKFDEDTQTWPSYFDYEVADLPSYSGWSFSVNSTLENLCPGKYRFGILFYFTLYNGEPAWTPVMPPEYNGQDWTTWFIEITIDGPESYLDAEWDETTSGACDGTGELSFNFTGGTAPISVVWKKNDVTFDSGTGGPTSKTGLGNGTYKVIITDANGCTKELTHTISGQAAPVPVPILDIVQSGCDGEENSGKICLTGFSPNVDPEHPMFWRLYKTTTPPIPIGEVNEECWEDLEPGTYRIHVTDFETGCSKDFFVTINQVNPPEVVLSIQDIMVGGVCNSKATAVVTGGMPPYQYDWGSGYGSSNTETKSGFPVTHTVTIKDANGCTTTQQVINTNCGGIVGGGGIDIGIWPNPNIGIFEISFDLPSSYSNVVVKIYDLASNQVFSNNYGSFSSGSHSLTVNSGISIPALYMLKIECDSNIIHETIQFIRQP